MSDFDIQALVFVNEEWVEVIFADFSSSSPNVKTTLTKHIRRSTFKDLVGSLEEDIEELLREAYSEERHPSSPPAISDAEADED